MARWSQLVPLDIHLLVFEMLAQDPTANENKEQRGRPWTKKHPLSSYALVCRDWQNFFEKKIYRHLALSQSSLRDFDNFVRRQRGLVEYIWLKIKLARYTCTECVEFGLPKYQANHSTAEEAISRLFRILSTWDRDQVAVSGRLTLEISAHSHSDLHHAFFSDLYFDTSPFATGEPLLTDPGHAWVTSPRSRPLELASISRLFGVPLRPEFEQRLPPVAVINALVIRRQTRQRFAPNALLEVLSSLPNLSSMTYESWRDFLHFPRGTYLLQHRLAIIAGGIKRLDDIRGFQRGLQFYTLYRYDYKGVAMYSRASLAKRSLSLGRLSASYIVDAADFFKASHPTWVWNRLTSLSLTSRLLVCTTGAAEVNQLLMEAGTAAVQMPKLTKMDIWNGTKGNACIFRYEANGDYVTVRWRGTWNLDIDPEVIDVWKKVAQLCARKDLAVLRSETSDKTAIKSHAAAIQELGIGEHVIHRVSLKQIQKETERYWF
ncbi:Uncharacterized protein TPAR_07636 [Tolypocladium paradoxum]|uniref:DUF6546 domain-containing protein n=1 Tax=Tolypocladium paradoxum TaxID=94208 RepID=A0A2S4KPS2_9HYPO|nr:Uncharacterized protein TPAR_07636 [Tolypocladium paradoxum]